MDWIVAYRRALVALGAALLLVSGFLELSEDVARVGAGEPTLVQTDRGVLVVMASERRPVAHGGGGRLSPS